MLGKSTRIHHHGAGVAPACSSLILVVCLCLVCFAQPARADIVVDQAHPDVSPAGPAGWTSGTDGYIGEDASGKLTVDDGSELSSKIGYVGSESGSTGEVTVDGNGSTWTNASDLTVGYSGSGTLNITGGGEVSNSCGRVGRESGSEGVVTVNGDGSTWTSGGLLKVGIYGSGTLDITGGGTVSSVGGIIAECSSSTSDVTVDGAGSTWTNSGDLNIGYKGSGTLEITGGGLVSVAGTLIIDYNGNGGSFVNMTGGGMLALKGSAADLNAFLGLISGTDAIQYWNKDKVGGADWDDIDNATAGDDYTVAAGTGDLDGYTVLTAPEPATIALLSLGFAGMAVIRRRRGRLA